MVNTRDDAADAWNTLVSAMTTVQRLMPGMAKTMQALSDENMLLQKRIIDLTSSDDRAINELEVSQSENITAILHGGSLSNG